MINKCNTPDGSYTTERIFVNYINENRVATPFGITTLIILLLMIKENA